MVLVKINNVVHNLNKNISEIILIYKWTNHEQRIWVNNILQYTGMRLICLPAVIFKQSNTRMIPIDCPGSWIWNCQFSYLNGEHFWGMNSVHFWDDSVRPEVQDFRIPWNACRLSTEMHHLLLALGMQQQTSLPSPCWRLVLFICFKLDSVLMKKKQSDECIIKIDAII